MESYWFFCFSYLNITSLRADDAGLYVCEAKNSAGSAKHGALLHIRGPPHVKPMPARRLVSGRDEELRCRVSGHPINEITWQKDGENSLRSVLESLLGRESTTSDVTGRL